MSTIEKIVLLPSSTKSTSSATSTWSPVVGPEAQRVTNAVVKDAEGREIVLKESLQILANCTAPDATGNKTGLVIGYVQSGKTVSFTTVAALARDNGYRLVIVIAGTSNPLYDQSNGRLENDLGPFGSTSKWMRFTTNSLKEKGIAYGAAIKQTLLEWSDPSILPDECQSVLITVMKHHQHLEQVKKVLAALPDVLGSTPTLIIDDEGDQASMNTLVNSEDDDESRTYAKIKELRSLLPSHTFIQYTATPQAPLLINVIDTLSPDFAVVLTPGSAYTGGKTFFKEGALVKEIPLSDLPSEDEHRKVMPPTLDVALRIFFVGVAAGYLKKEGGNRSFLLHPDRLVSTHERYLKWVTNFKDNSQEALENKRTKADRDTHIAKYQKAYAELATTVNDLPAFEEIIRVLPRLMAKTIITEMNASKGNTPQPDWGFYSHILIGGTALDRGFTVNGLTVTYMSRGLGVANADTLQQRARWFGYKSDYLGYCRVFLPKSGVEAFTLYVEHEESVRGLLKAHIDKGLPLKQWKRAFILDPMYEPTRGNVLDLSHRFRSFENWVPTTAPHISESAVVENRVVIDAFVSTLSLASVSPDPKETVLHRIQTSDPIPFTRILEEVLSQFRYADPKDSTTFSLISLYLGRYAQEHPNTECKVYVMDPLNPRGRAGLKNGTIQQLQQGGNAKYIGDREVREDNILNLQIFRTDVYDGPVKNGVIQQADVPAFAIFIPKAISSKWLIQEDSH